LRCWFITDTFALMFLLVVPLLPRLRSNTRVVVGGASIMVSRLLYVLHPGRSAVTLLLMDILFGPHPNGPRVLYENYALVPMSGMFLVGSQLGMGFARAQAQGREATAPRRYILAALGLFSLGAVLFGTDAILRHEGRTFWRAVFYPDYSFTLYPFYVAAMLAMIAILLRSHWLPGARRFVAVIGRQSLWVYVAQYYVVEWLPFILKIYGEMTVRTVLLYLPGAIVILYLTARAFERPWRFNTLALATPGPQPPPPATAGFGSPGEPSDRSRSG
jgi:hypothetical protein